MVNTVHVSADHECDVHSLADHNISQRVKLIFISIIA